MNNSPKDGESEQGAAKTRSGDIIKLAPKLVRKSLRPVVAAERVAALMIARHGVNAAREATVRLNQMIDRGNLPARDLWACVVHVIHERRAS